MCRKETIQKKTKTRLKVYLVIPSLHKGGAERIMSILANFLSHDKFEITLILLQKRGSYIKTLADHVMVINLNIDNVRKSFFPLLKLIKEKKPHIVFSALGHLNILLSFIKLFTPKEVKFIARETNIPSIINKTEKYPLIFDVLYKALYSNFNKIVCQSNDMANDLINNYGISNEKIEIINNPINLNGINVMLENNEKADLPSDKFNFVAIGSLEYRKGFDLLLESWSLINDREKLFLTIIGEGSQKDHLDSLIKKNNLQDSVKLIGFQENPYIFLKSSDAFILSSRYEGFPNILLEALACGTSAIAFNCPGGINEIILNGENGWLVEAGNVNEMAKVIVKNQNVSFSKKQIIDDVERRYSLNFILNKYENLFLEICK